MAFRRAPPKAVSPLDKLAPRNPKYAGVASKLDTGLTVHKVKVISAAQYAQRREELFFRINRNQMFELYNEYEADEYEDIAEAETRNMGGPRIVTHDHSARSEYSKPYLILDIRDTDQYNAYHMLQARSFPVVMLRRDQTHPEVAMFRNREGHMIILVSDDERVAREAATVMVNRGLDNIYLLTGGINEFAAHFPSYIEGTIPEDVAPKAPVSIQLSGTHSPTGKANLTVSALRNHSMSSGGSSRARAGNLSARSSRHGGDDDGRRSVADSEASTRSVADSIISRATSRRGRF